jgi:hypothetical protein
MAPLVSAAFFALILTGLGSLEGFSRVRTMRAFLDSWGVGPLSYFHAEHCILVTYKHGSLQCVKTECPAYGSVSKLPSFRSSVLSPNLHKLRHG